MSYIDLYKRNTFKKVSVLCEMDHPVYSNVTTVLWCYYAHYRTCWTLYTIMWVRMIYWYYYVYYIDQLWWTHALVRHITVYRSNIILYIIDINLYNGSSQKSNRFVYEYILRYSFDRHRFVFAIVNNSSQQSIGIMIMKLLILWKSDE